MFSYAHKHCSRHRSVERGMVVASAIWAAAALLARPQNAQGQAPGDNTRHCDVEPGPGVIVTPGLRGGSGGMAGNGWDGSGQGSATVYWHVEGTTPDTGAGQRIAIIDALQAWADVVQITFIELPIANANAGIDLNFLTGNHSASESQESGDPDCPFDGAGGVLAHAGFPPGVNSTCINPMAESWAGNVHFDEAETWEQDNESGAGAHGLTLVACHEIGHGIGLTHSGGNDVMRPSFGASDAFVGLTANDIANIRAGYASGTGAVYTLNDLGVWVDNGYAGVERGTLTQPFNTVGEGVNGVPPFSTGVTVHIDAGTYSGTLLVDRNMFLEPVNGSVVIGG